MHVLPKLNSEAAISETTEKILRYLGSRGSNFKRFNMKVSFGTLQKKTTTVGNFCNMVFCNTLLIKTFALYRPSIGKEWNGSKYKSKLRSGKIHTLTYIMYNIGATFF